MDDDRRDYRVVYATEKDMDEIRRNDSIAVIAGSHDKDSLENIFGIVQHYGPIKDGFTFYIITGEQLNDYYEFGDDERFEADSHLVVFKLDSVGDPARLHSDMKQWNGRIFTDLMIERQRLDTKEGQDRYRAWIAKRMTKGLLGSEVSEESAIKIGEFIGTHIFFEDGRVRFMEEDKEDHNRSGLSQDEQ